MEKSIRNKQSIERGVERRPVQEEEVDFKNVLADLWYSVVKPVLDFLGYEKNVDETENMIRHVTWCPTGALSFLPLHAAGDYDRPRSRVFDYVISSYTPTLTALLSSVPRTLSSSRVLVIGQDATPGHQPLPGTAKELEYVVSHIKGRVEYLELFGDQATTTTVLEAMEQHEWVHLACHAHQNVQDPTDSGFFLHDGTLDLASINQRSFKSKGLAFLSACQTATGDEKLPDEAIHLASGMLMAGYSSVIATMWSVYDEDAPLVADRVYAQLMKDRRIGNGEAGKALHDAIAELRRKVGEKEFSRWVPYIHVGS
ncbi:CHAT domain protein [Rhizoctonia solani]|uniref:CHAT domain protein n=1 Tax=Rhizoctonia solani TaxID=456999 RepID=A0A8H8NQ58_9AGAM|nr:CHAT domain protein [Rhizoctonia solani]QRW16747.1 CHAT domain protein [Rhizoctonia solani]